LNPSFFGERQWASRYTQSPALRWLFFSRVRGSNARFKGPQGLSQVLSDLGNEVLQVRNIMFRRRAGIDWPFLVLSWPRHPLDTNTLEPPRAHESKGNLPCARMDLRIVRSCRKGQMAVLLGLVLRHIAAELSNEGAVVPFHLPVRLWVIRRGIVQSHTE